MRDREGYSYCMKTRDRVSWGVLMVGMLIIQVVTFAAEVRTGNSPTLAQAETTKGDIYLMGGNTTSAGKVNGDLIAAGGTVVVNGSVSQDLIVGAGSITVIADVGDDVRIGGGNILINGKVGNDVLIGGGQVQISGSNVGGDVLWVGGALHVTSPVGGNMSLSGGEVTINSHVRGNVEFKGGKITLGKGAIVDGNLDYVAESEAVMEEGAVVRGKTTFVPLKASSPSNRISAKGILAILSIFILGKFLAMFVFALVLGLLFKHYAQTLVEHATSQPLLEMGRGLIVLIVLPVASIMALVTIIGIPLGILGLLAFIILMLVTSGLSLIITGSVVHKWIFKPVVYQISWKTILLGAVVYTLIGFIPLLGYTAKFLIVLLTLGSVVKIKMDVAKGWR